ncbi:MAG: hypothetical protein K0R70_646 [Steroidobacteraceae bacterium]|nr:hypothetical protein [Steroidobacteraceae bacterium]
MRELLEPRPTDIAAALRTTTEALARELVSPTARAPEWTELEWRIAEAASAMHGVSALLGGASRWEGPARWQRFLQEQRHQTSSRHAGIVELLRNLDTLSRREGVAMTTLKGVALHALGVYRPGERPMADVDLVVRASDRAAATRVLEAAGYAVCLRTWKHDNFAPRAAHGIVGFGESAANPVNVDLHVRIRERLPVVEVDITPKVLVSQPQPGLNDYRSIAALMTHLLLHAAGNMRFRSLRLIQLHDIARLAARLTADDWNAVVGIPPHWWALPPLQLASHYFPQVVPLDVLARLERACPRWLRRACRRQSLTDVSLSNLWIEAFPGIEWSPTPRERVRYVVDRIWPRREVLVAREDVVRAVPWLAESAWTRMPQWRRILHWARSRRPRYETWHSVAAALRDAPVEAAPAQRPEVSSAYNA